MSTSWFEAKRSAERALLALAAVALLTAGCGNWDAYPWQVRVPLTDVGAQFLIADATWFEAEQTLFVFYRVDSAEGLSEASQIELRYLTDEVDQDWISIDRLPVVHHHQVVSCGPRSICGSYSTPVERVPRQVGLRLRYHRDGELTLDPEVEVTIVGDGPPHQSRSAQVYGVFDEENRRVQWRLRHQFPSIRNQHAQKLGLRRDLRIEEPAWGTLSGGAGAFGDNLYGYGLVSACPPDFVEHPTEVLETEERAIFDPEQLSLDASDAPVVCARATVTDALGEFTATALARKNPETRPAFPALQTPITENTLIPFFLEVCDEGTTEAHRRMQMQRLFLDDSHVVCIDDWDTPGFPDRLATLLSARVDQVRQQGEDMILSIGLHRPDEEEIAAAVEAALAVFVPPEMSQATPRLSGVFLFDSYPHAVTTPEVSRVVLWCPADLGTDDLDSVPDTSQRSCAVQPEMPFELGEASVSSLPILPTEPQFQEFIEEYGEHQTGRMTALTAEAPTRTPTSRNVPLDQFGVATFFNDEAIFADPGDAFSYCAEDDTGFVVVGLIGLPEDIPSVLPLSLLGQVHAALRLPRYELGLAWDFPFLLHLEYESTVAAAVSTPPDFPFALSLGLGSPAEQFAGGAPWEADKFEIGDALSQCDRFCDHPTFDSAGVYNVAELFSQSYPDRCYRPNFPHPADDGFPVDP